jgi:hypothetical protein
LIKLRVIFILLGLCWVTWERLTCWG